MAILYIVNTLFFPYTTFSIPLKFDECRKKLILKVEAG